MTTTWTLRALSRYAEPVFGPAWQAIQRHCPELPMPAIVLSGDDMPDYGARTHVPGSKSWMFMEDQCSPDRWEVLTIEIALPGLQVPADRTMGLLLHEAAHVLDWCRSGQISGHSGAFAAIGSELGLDVPADPADAAILSAEAAKRFSTTIRGLDRRLRHYRPAIDAWKPYAPDYPDTSHPEYMNGVTE